MVRLKLFTVKYVLVTLKYLSKTLHKIQVVYYMQIKDQLPSLHRLMEWSQKDYQILNDYAWNFASLEDAKQAARNGSSISKGGRPKKVPISGTNRV